MDAVVAILTMYLSNYVYMIFHLFDELYFSYNMPYNAECKTVLTFIIPTRKYNRLAKTVISCAYSIKMVPGV